MSTLETLQAEHKARHARLYGPPPPIRRRLPTPPDDPPRSTAFIPPRPQSSGMAAAAEAMRLEALIEKLTADLRSLDRVKQGYAFVRKIQVLVCVYFGVAVDDVLSERRTANVVLPRQIAMYLTKALTLRSLPEIGRRFGGRDHTTVLHAVRKIEALRQSDERIAAYITALIAQLGREGE